MYVTHSLMHDLGPSAVADRGSEPVIGAYRRPASCASPRAQPASGLRPNYPLRRLAAAAGAVVIVLVFAVTVVVLGSLLASLGGDPAVAAETSPAPVVGDGSSDDTAPTVHVARAGDTLWSIAQSYRGEVSHERYVDALVRLNDGASIQVGQAVRLP